MKRILISGVVGLLFLGIGIFGGCSTEFIENEVQDMVDSSEFVYSITMDSLGLGIGLHSDEENAVFECAVDNGQIAYYPIDEVGYVGVKSKTLNQGERLYWVADEEGAEYASHAYIDVIVKADTHIIGYAVIEIYEDPNSDNYMFYAECLKSVEFPKSDGEYQSVTSKYVQSKMDEIKGGNYEN